MKVSQTVPKHSFSCDKRLVCSSVIAQRVSRRGQREYFFPSRAIKLTCLTSRSIHFPAQAPTSYDDSLKSSVIIPTPVLERDAPDKYNNHHNNNNNISNLSVANSSSSSAALKIEDETSNLMIEDRQTTATRWIRDSASRSIPVKNIQFPRSLSLQLIDRVVDAEHRQKRQQQAAIFVRGPHRYRLPASDHSLWSNLITR